MGDSTVLDDGSVATFDGTGALVSTTSPSGVTTPADTSIVDSVASTLGSLADTYYQVTAKPAQLVNPGASGSPITAGAPLTAAQKSQLMTLLLAGAAILAVLKFAK